MLIQCYTFSMFQKCVLKEYFVHCESITPGQMVMRDPKFQLNKFTLWGLIIAVIANDYVYVLWV